MPKVSCAFQFSLRIQRLPHILLLCTCVCVFVWNLVSLACNQNNSDISTKRKRTKKYPLWCYLVPILCSYRGTNQVSKESNTLRKQVSVTIPLHRAESPRGHSTKCIPVKSTLSSSLKLLENNKKSQVNYSNIKKRKLSSGNWNTFWAYVALNSLELFLVAPVLWGLSFLPHQ